MSKILAKKDLGKFIKFLKKRYRVFAAVKKGRIFLFSEVEKLDKIFNNQTMLPPKKIFYPAAQTLFQFAGTEIKNTNKPVKPLAIIGLNSLDINALSLLDRIMIKSHDQYYCEMRKNSLIIGVGENRVNLTGDFDLFLEDKLDEYSVTIGSHLGKSVIKNHLFKKNLSKTENALSTPNPLFSDTIKLSSAIKASINDKIWDNLAKICFGCGNCVYVCPLCYCFDIKDNIDLNGSSKDCSECSGSRIRYWDACFLEHFFEVSGHNFKPLMRDRIYNWYYHKFVRMPKEFGFVGCVSCERCIKYCPARINYREVLEKVLKKYS